MITVKQDHAYATIALFDKSVEKIVGMPISAMMQINAQVKTLKQRLTFIFFGFFKKIPTTNVWILTQS